MFRITWACFNLNSILLFYETRPSLSISHAFFSSFSTLIFYFSFMHYFSNSSFSLIICLIRSFDLVSFFNETSSLVRNSLSIVKVFF